MLLINNLLITLVQVKTMYILVISGFAGSSITRTLLQSHWNLQIFGFNIDLKSFIREFNAIAVHKKIVINFNYSNSDITKHT